MPEAWRMILARSVGDAATLLRKAGVCEEQVGFPVDFDRPFPVKVPPRYVRKIEYGKADDPLLLQVLPLKTTGAVSRRFARDPLQEEALHHSTGELSKYSGRSLLLTTGACAINCQFCFRQNLDYPPKERVMSRLRQNCTTVQNDDSVKEVILSGGDPLTLNDELLRELFRELEMIDHLRTVRLHTRVPIVLPERVTPGLRRILQSTAKRVVVVLHVNHPRELDSDVVESLNVLQQCQLTMLSQSVLLKGVNDRASVLVELSENLDQAGVIPYYLHLLDPVRGSEMFAVSVRTARALLGRVASRLPGYLVPRLAREVPGEAAKRILAPLAG